MRNCAWIVAVLACAIARPAISAEQVFASLRVGAGDATFEAKVVADERAGYRLRIRCVEACSQPVDYHLDTETPLGLFQLSDADDLLMSTWVSGSAYRVRVHRLTLQGVSMVLDAPTLGAPSILSNGNGWRVVTTVRKTERAAPGIVRRVIWAWDGSRFRAR